jgi:hypothetical protein
MRQTRYPVGAPVTYVGRYWLVCGYYPDGSLYLRAVGWEHGAGWFGWDGYGRPIQVATVVSPMSPLLYPV